MTYDLLYWTNIPVLKLKEDKRADESLIENWLRYHINSLISEIVAGFIKEMSHGLIRVWLLNYHSHFELIELTDDFLLGLFFFFFFFSNCNTASSMEISPPNTPMLKRQNSNSSEIANNDLPKESFNYGGLGLRKSKKQGSNEALYT